MNPLLVALIVFFSGSLMASESCQEQYHLGKAALDDGRSAAGIELIEAASQDCDQAVFWQALGDAKAAIGSVSEGSELDADKLQEEALGDYGNAFAAARREQDSAAGATAARSIVELGLRAGDPLKAQNWLAIAERLDPAHPELPNLHSKLDAAREELSTSEIDVGFSQTRGLGRINSLLGGDVTASAFWDPAASTSQYAAEPLDSAGGGSEQPSLSIQIQFETNTTRVTAATAKNIENLASVLAAQPESVEITLIGHADIRGEEGYNLSLSHDRAKQVQQQLIVLQPTLNGRITALGDGESRPIDLGTTERAHANNRRLEVTLSSPGQAEG